MTPDEQAFADRVDGVLASMEAGTPSLRRLRQIPMDLVLVAVMRQMSRDGAPDLLNDAAITIALTEIADRNC